MQVILRLPEVVSRVGLSRTEIYRRIARGTFPHMIELGPRAVGWRESDVDKWIAKLATKPLKSPASSCRTSH